MRRSFSRNVLRSGIWHSSLHLPIYWSEWFLVLLWSGFLLLRRWIRTARRSWIIRCVHTVNRSTHWKHRWVPRQEHWISIEQPETRHRKQLIRQRQHLTAMRNCFRFQVRAVPENIVIRIWQTRCLRLQEILLETVEKRCMIHFLILFSQQHAREDMQPV